MLFKKRFRTELSIDKRSFAIKREFKSFDKHILNKKERYIKFSLKLRIFLMNISQGMYSYT